MVFSRVPFLKPLEVNEGVVPGVKKKILLPALPVVGAVPDSPRRQHLSDRFQELERNQIKARLSIRPLCATHKTRNVVRGLHANESTLFQTSCAGKVGDEARPADNSALALTTPSPCDNPRMVIGNRIRALREANRLSQGDIQKRIGLLRPYLSRIENSHTIPALETLEKLARALEIPLYQLFYEREEPP